MLPKLSTFLWAGGSAVAAAATAIAVPDVPVNGTTASVLGTVVAGVVYGALALRKRLSSDGLEAKVNSTAGELLNRLTKERDDAMQDARAAWSSKNADSLELGELRAKVGYLEEQLRVNLQAMTELRRGVQVVGRTVDAVKGRMEETTKQLGTTGPAPLGKD